MPKSIEFGIRQPSENFDRRPSESNTPNSPSYPGKKGKGSGGGNHATQTKKVGMGDRQQGK